MEMKENIKIGLLGIIALTLVVDTFIMNDTSSNTVKEQPQSNIAANTVQPNTVVPPMPDPNINQPQQVSQSESRAKTSIKFAEMNHDFGGIEQNSKHTKIFKFTNTGTEPLIIENASGSCGCTVPTFPKEPIAPGKTGEIEVVYSPGTQQGAQTKTVTITANTEPITTTLNISANVHPAN